MFVVATIEARMTSSRCPGKVLLPLHGEPMLARIIERVRRARTVNEVVIATTTNDTDEPIVSLGERVGARVFRGSEADVLARVLGAARSVSADAIVEITGDCPLADPKVIDLHVERFQRGDVDYVSNILRRTYPAGIDTQVFSVDVLGRANERGTQPGYREHVSLFIYEHPEIFRLANLESGLDERCADLWFTVDYPEDIHPIRAIYDGLYPANPAFSLDDVLRFVDAHPELLPPLTRRPRAKSFWQ